jgi:pyruvate/2-oxoglutarate dehydrogenase complex dihydrolipoamide acyltransferase (E2) component
MAVEVVKMPKVGETMEEGSVIEWIVEVGEVVDAGHPLVVVSTDKVEYEVESPQAGTVVRLAAGEGETVSVGEPLCEIDVTE